MKLSRKHLNTFFESAFCRLPTDQIISTLNTIGLSVEGVEPVFQSEGLQTVVLGQVVRWQKHPNADRLRTCEVDMGSETLPIVCGAQNFNKGDYVPVACVGTTLPNGMTIRQTTIRGQESKGMICSASELGIEGLVSDSGIWNISMSMGGRTRGLSQSKGKPIADVLGLSDEMITLELTPNRGDCLGYLGVTRELSAAFNLKLKHSYSGRGPTCVTPQDTGLPMRMDAGSDLVPTFLLQVWETRWDRQHVTPFEVQWLLWLHEVPLIHPLVDLGNFVMLESGQPIHIYDVSKIEGTLSVREAKAGEVAQTLLGESMEARGGEVVIADDAKLLCVGGVIGMKDAAVDMSTETFWVEAAHFDSVSVGSTSQKLGVSTDASHRFERGVDRNLPALALKRFAAYLKRFFGVLGPSRVVALRQDPVVLKTVTCQPQQILNLVRGPDIQSVKHYLVRLGFKVRGVKNQWDVTVPSFRFDVDGYWDLAEEVARSFGYEQFSDDLHFRHSVVKPARNKGISVLRRVFAVSDRLVALGYQENVHVGFLSKSVWKDPLSAFVSPKCWVELENPINQERRFLPPMLFPLLLERFQWLRDRGVPVMKLFEVGKVFSTEGDNSGNTMTFREERHLAMLMSVSSQQAESSFTHPVWEPKAAIPNSEILWLTDAVRSALSQMGWDTGDLSFVSKAGEIKLRGALFHPHAFLEVCAGNRSIGFVAQIHPEHASVKKRKSVRCFVAEIDMEAALDRIHTQQSVTAPSAFPVVTRDVSIRCRDDIGFAQLDRKMRHVLPKACVNVALLDRFDEGDGMMSLTFRLFYENSERTLSDDEVNSWQEEFRLSLMKHCPIEYK